MLDGEPFVASASEDGDIVLWDVKNKEILQRVPTGHKGICFWVDVNGDTMASAGQDHTIRVYRHVREGADTNGSLDLEAQVESQLQSELPIRQDGIKLEDA